MISLILKAESKRIVTDAFLLLMLVMPPLVAILLRLYWPSLATNFPGWSIEQYKPAMSALMALLTPLIMGLVLGFNLLTDREQGMLSVIRTTPAGLARYLIARSYGYFIISLITTPILHEILNFVDITTWQLIVISFSVQILLPFSALILLTFARNLVEGFAVMKSTGFLVSVPIILAMFVPEPWYWLAAPLPTWWSIWGYFQLAEGEWLAVFWLLFGAVFQAALVLVLWQRLMRAEN